MEEVENNPLVRAVKQGDSQRMKRLIRRGADMEETGQFGYTPLMEAVRENNMEITSFLVRKGANVNAISSDTKETALSIASFSGMTNFVAYLVRNGADTELGECTALMDAAVEGHLHTVNFLLENTTAVINARSAAGYSPLSYACENNHTEVANILLDYGARIENECLTGQTPLMIACYRGHVATVRILLGRNANVHHVGRGNETALTIASATGHVEIVKLLIEKGSDVNHEADGSLTPLMLACNMGHLEVVKTLVRKKANVNHVTPAREYTALSMACLGGQVDVVKYLMIRANADPTISLNDHKTLLLETVRGGVTRSVSDRRSVEIAYFLLEFPHNVFEKVDTSDSEDEL